MMEVKVNALVAIASILISIPECCANNDIHTEYFTTASCSNTRYDLVLKAQSSAIETAESALYCALSCAQNNQCNFAVFRQSRHRCEHVFAYEGSPTTALPAYANHNGCIVLHKKNKPLCQNGGDFPGDIQCLCPTEFYGQECELQTPNFCNLNSWREITPADHFTLMKSPLAMKLVTDHGQTTSSRTISDVNYFYTPLGKIKVQSHNFLSVDVSAENFEIPLKREFLFFSGEAVKLTRDKVTMAGLRTNEAFPNAIFQALILDAVDQNRVVYEPGVTGTVDEAIAELKAGHRLIMRDPAVTDFTESTNDIVYQRPRSEIGATSTSLGYPLYFFSTKQCITQNIHSVTRWYIGVGTHKLSDPISRSNKIEFDRCWQKLTPSSDEDLLGRLREAILSRGQEVRLVMGSTTATDITMVTVSDSDVIASLAEYLSPTDYSSELTSSSKFFIWSVSLSKTLTKCAMTFQGSTVHQIVNETYPSSLEWVVSSREWVSKFVQTWTGSGVEASGSHNDVYSAAMNGRSIRVCVEKTLHVSTCFTGVSLTLDDSNQHLMIQSPAALGVDLNPDRTFSGDVGPDCKRMVYLVSTKGWVKTASYVTGVEDPPGAVVTLNFLKLTWFQQS